MFQLFCCFGEHICMYVHEKHSRNIAWWPSTIIRSLFLFCSALSAVAVSTWEDCQTGELSGLSNWMTTDSPAIRVFAHFYSYLSMCGACAKCIQRDIYAACVYIRQFFINLFYACINIEFFIYFYILFFMKNE